MTTCGSPATTPTLDATDNDTAAADEITDSLIKGLEAPTDDDDSGSEGEVGATNAGASALQALQYATYMTGTLQFVKEKHRVQGYLAAELVRAQKEFGEDGDDRSTKRPTLEGNIDHYSIKKQITRRQNKKSPGFLSAVRMIWDATRAEMAARLGESCDAGGANEEDASGIDKAAFVCLMVKVHYLIICPPVDREVAYKNASNDWAKDNTDGGRYMSYESFVASIFELVDLWTETLASEEYDALAMMIAKGVTTEVETTEAEAPPDSTDSPSGRESGEEREGGTGSVKRTALRVTRSFLLKSDAGIVYEPTITKEPVYMEDLIEEEVDDADDGKDDDGGGNVEEEENADKNPETEGRAQGSRRTGRNAAGQGGARLRRAVHRRFGGVRGFKKPLPPGSPDFDAEEDGVHAAVSSLSHQSRASKTALLSTDRINAQIAKIYYSKMQVDLKLLERDGNTSWVDKCKRKKDQRMDRFVLQYHIRQFGTKKLARRNLHQLCKSITKLALNNPRISVFAELTGVSVMVQKRPYAERTMEFRPFACSDFIIPMLTKLCPPGEKMDRWLGNGKVPVSVTLSDFMLAVKEVCPDVPTECPAFVSFVVQVGRLVERLEKRCRQEKLQKPNAARPSLDLDEALIVAMPVWSAEEEYLIMKVTLNALHILRRWMLRWRRRKEAGETLPPPTHGHPRPKTVRKTKRTQTATGGRPLTKSGSEPLSTLGDSPRRNGSGVAEPLSPGRRQLRESASFPANVPTSAGVSCTATETTTVESRVTTVGGEKEKLDSPRTRQRLEQAKQLDQEVAAGQGGGGG